MMIKFGYYPDKIVLKNHYKHEILISIKYYSALNQENRNIWEDRHIVDT